MLPVAIPKFRQRYTLHDMLYNPLSQQ